MEVLEPLDDKWALSQRKSFMKQMTELRRMRGLDVDTKAFISVYQAGYHLILMSLTQADRTMPYG